MPWPWNRVDRTPRGEDLRVVVTIQWGLARVGVVSAPSAPPLWLHGVVIDAMAERRDGAGVVQEDHALAVGTPLRLSPGGRFDDAWRPAAFALDDGGFHRPAFRCIASVSVHRRHPVTIEPAVEVVDDFTWTDGRYELIEGSRLWRETHEPPERL